MKKLTRRLSLHQRLLMLGMAPAAAMFVVLLFFLTSARINDARTDLYNTAQLIADNLAPATEYAVVSGNRAAIAELLDVTLNQGNLSRITIRTARGEIMGEAVKEELLDDEPLQVFTADIVQLPVDLAQGYSPGWLEPEYGMAPGSALSVGSVEVAVSDQVIDARRWTIIWTSAILGVALLLITFLFANRFAYQLSAPIRRFADRVEKIGKGHYSVQSEPLDTAELGTLQSAIVTLAARLESADIQQQDTLEHMAVARDKAESASQAKSEFLGLMSHELRTPLNGILGMLDLLDEKSLDADQEEYLRTARGSTEDLLTIITDLLDFSRIEQGRLAIRSAPYALQPLFTNCGASFRHQAEQKGLDYQIRLDGSWDTTSLVVGDPIRLRQVMAHLIENAIKFTEEGQVCASAHWQPLSGEKGVFTFEVKDSGVGIPGEEVENIFNSFAQLDASSTRSFGGAGLGLALVQRLVELMGGQVNVDSAVACGSTFQVVLPLDRVNQEPKATADAPTPYAPNASARRALVVEDNPVNQRVARRMLENLGFEVECADNGAHAIEVLSQRGSGLERSPYDIVLMDCQMPVMDGWEATRRIRKWEKDRKQAPVPIIAMTADVLDDTEAHCRAAGMDDYLCKPVRRDKVRDALKHWLVL